MFLFFNKQIHCDCFLICAFSLFSFDKLQTTYNQRPSREEDLKKIESLEITVTNQQKTVEETNNKMNHLKRELLNRENVE